MAKAKSQQPAQSVQDAVKETRALILQAERMAQRLTDHAEQLKFWVEHIESIENSKPAEKGSGSGK